MRPLNTSTMASHWIYSDCHEHSSVLRNRLALDATILAEPSWFEWTVYGAQWLPFPMTHADLVIHARWTDLADVRPLAHEP